MQFISNSSLECAYHSVHKVTEGTFAPNNFLRFHYLYRGVCFTVGGFNYDFLHLGISNYTKYLSEFHQFEKLKHQVKNFSET